LVAEVSAIFAARLADKIGLIQTMVVTHLPINVLITLVPLMPNEGLAVIILIMRFCISQMDVPTRNAYVQGVVATDERSAANGVTNVVRSVGAGIECSRENLECACMERVFISHVVYFRHQDCIGHVFP
jgi:predicted MFS family arabinose efflux permease